MTPKTNIINEFAQAGFSHVRSVGQVVHYLTKDGIDYGLIILKKTKPGYMYKYKRLEHSIDKRHLAQFPVEYHGNVFIIILETQSGENLIANSSSLEGTDQVLNNVEVLSAPRAQFKPLKDILVGDKDQTTLMLNQLNGNSNSTN